MSTKKIEWENLFQTYFEDFFVKMTFFYSDFAKTDAIFFLKSFFLEVLKKVYVFMLLSEDKLCRPF